MTVLAGTDAERLLRFAATAEELGGDDPFTPDVLVELGKIVEADAVTYCAQDRVRQRHRYAVIRPGDDESDEPVPYWEIAGEHPICRRHNALDCSALKLSDFVSLRQLRRSRIYSLWFRPFETEHELSVAIPSPLWHTKTFLFDRGPGADFTERDRLVLNLLQPHLARLWRSARTKRRLRAALAALESAPQPDGRGGVVVLGPGRTVDFVSPSGRRLLRRYFGAHSDAELPAALQEWLDSPERTLVVGDASLQLTIDRSGNALMLEEMQDALGLTPRERQILAFVARGSTNREIAETLWISPSTVRKHLENIYAKLGVRTRTAAAARLLGALGGDDD